MDNFIPCRPVDAGIGFYPCQYGCTRYNTPFSYVGINTTKPSTFDQVMAYTQSNDIFLKDYALAFARMMNVGYGASPSNPGKLGYLTAIDLDSCNLPLCQFAGMCSKSSDCTLGNKCVFSDHYSHWPLRRPCSRLLLHPVRCICIVHSSTCPLVSLHA